MQHTNTQAPLQGCPPQSGVRVGPPLSTRREFAAAAAAAALAAGLAGAGTAFADDAGDGDDLGSTDPEEGADREAGADDAGEVFSADDEGAAAEAEAAGEEDASDPVDPYDDEGNLNVLLGYADRTEEVSYEPAASFELPLGSVVYADCETRAAVIQRNDSMRPLTVLGCLDYESGAYTVVLDEPLSGSGFTPSEAHATDSLVAWLEVNNTTDEWFLYAAPFDGSPLGGLSVTTLAEGDADWLYPQFDASGRTVAWQVMPDPSGPYSMESSLAYVWTLGQATKTQVWESPGRFACEPSLSAGVLTLAPRVTPSKGVYYGLVALDLDRDLQVVDELSMPVSVKPFRATRIGDEFAFSVEADYGYGGRLGSMGYCVGPGEGPFRYLTREPSAHICAVGGRYIVRSLLSYFVIDPEDESYTVLSAASGCVDYGDYPACAGTVGSFVTYAAVKDSATGVPSHVLVRIFSLL
jgi:hypothetical protein